MKSLTSILALANRRLEEISLVIIVALGISECSDVDAPRPGEGITLESQAEPLKGPTIHRAEAPATEINGFGIQETVRAEVSRVGLESQIRPDPSGWRLSEDHSGAGAHRPFFPESRVDLPAHADHADDEQDHTRDMYRLDRLIIL